MIVFARHGQTTLNRRGLLQGRVDAALTELGRDQARRIGVAIAARPPTRVVCSPLLRAHETAEIVAETAGLSLAPEVDDRLVELDYGAWEERAVADVTAREWAHWQADSSFAPPGGESLESVRERVGEFCEEALRGDEDLLCVSHVSPIKAAVAWALGAPDAATWHMYLAVASICRIEARGAQPVLASFNETAHLAGS